jgi:hypothetical protein
MIVVRVYTGADGEAHTEELEVPMDEVADGFMSKLFELKGGYFRESTYDGARDFHNARWRHLCVPIVGGFELRCGDGSTYRIVPGTVMLGEDVDGRGHASVEIDPPRLTLFLPVPDDFDVSSWKRIVRSEQQATTQAP